MYLRQMISYSPSRGFVEEDLFEYLAAIRYVHAVCTCLCLMNVLLLLGVIELNIIHGELTVVPSL